MQNIDKIPVAGWVVIAFIALLIFIVLMIKGLRFGIGNKKLVIGAVDKQVDDRLDIFKGEIEKRDNERMQDEERRKTLFRRSGEIDEKLKADERRVIRRLQEAIKNIFKPYIKCEMPGLTAAEIIKDELTERVDYNNMKDKLTRKERAGYIQDILFNIETDYKAFLLKIPRLPCGTEKYPEWKEIKGDVEKVIIRWADEMTEAMAKRIKEKIELYEAEKDKFLLAEYKTICIDFPINKNKKYLESLRFNG